MRSFRATELNHGFTLVELLVSITIVGMLAGFANAGLQKVISASHQAVEISAGRNMGQALLMYAQENNGTILTGYLSPQDPSLGQTLNDRGQLLSPSHAAQRYPWRLLPYMNNQVRGGVWVNKLKSQIPDTDPYRDYMVSLVPSLGMNNLYVGGDTRNIQLPGRCITRINRAFSPSSLIVFCSARYEDPNYGKVEGYFEVRPPTAATFSENSSPSATGWVHPRYQGKAVTVTLAGTVELLSYEQLKDMRRWCDEAARQDNPNWTP